MRNNKAYYKRLLAHTTFLTLVLNINTSIAVTTQTSVNNPSQLSNSSDWYAGPFADRDSIKFGGNHQIILNQPNYTVSSIDTNGYSGGKITAISPTALGNISSINTAGGGNGATTIELANDVELFLFGDNFNSSDYSALTLIAPSASLGNGAGTINFGTLSGNDQNITFNLGTPALKLGSISSVSVVVNNFNNSIVPPGFLYADYSIRSILKSGKEIHANEFKLSPDNVWGYSVSPYLNNILELEDDTIVDAKVTNISASAFSGSGGRVFVNGSSTILKDLGTVTDPLIEVRFNGTSPSKIVHLSGNIYSQNIVIKQPTMSIDSDLTLNGQVAGDNSTIDLKNNILTFQYNIPEYDPSNGLPPSVLFTNDLTLNTTVNDNSFGRIIVDGLQELVDLTATNHMNVNLIDGTTTLPGSAGRTYIMLGTVTNGGTINIIPDNRVTFQRLQGGNPFVNWSYSNGVLTQTAKTQAEIEQIIRGFIPPNTGNTTVINVINLVNPSNTSQAAALGSNIITIVITDPASLADTIDRLDPTIVESTEATFVGAREVVITISERISSVSAPNFKVASEQDGVAAADDLSKYGAWGSIYYSKANQRGINESPGFKTSTTGGTIGVDTLVNDTVMLGAALSVNKVKIDHKDSNLGDKTHTNGYLFSLYGLKELTKKWFIQGVLSVGTNKINNREQRREGNVYNIARGSYNVLNYGAEILTGYEYNINESLLLTPLAGFSYNVIGDSWYQETGTQFSNFMITKKADHKAEAIAGARLAMSKDWNGTAIIPEVHGMIRYDMLNRSPKVDVRIDGLINPQVQKSKEINRAFFNLGCGANITKGRMEYGFIYDGYFARKYTGNQLTLKLRVNF